LSGAAADDWARRWRLTARPYWFVPPLSRTEIGGILLGAAMALLGLLLIA